MKPFILALILSGGFASGICINAGGVDTVDCGPDQYFSGGAVWGPTQQVNLKLGTLRYGTSFSYSIPLQPGAYKIALTFVEPNKTAVGQRAFTVAVGGQVSAPLDIFALAFTNEIYTVNYFAVVSTGVLRLDFKATIGNAMISRIETIPVAGVASITFNPVLDGATYRPQVRGELAGFVSEGVFSILHAPVDGSLAVYVNGLRRADFSITGNQITISATAADVVLCDYFYDAPIAPVV